MTRDGFTAAEQIELLDMLQNFDIGFVIAVPDFHQRKQMLEYQAMKWREKQTNIACLCDGNKYEED